MKDLILIRGVVGCGKSTLGELIGRDEFYVFAADDYFIVDGEYKFDGSKLKDAHANCQTRAENAMKGEMEMVIVANTFTRKWEMQAYYDLAEKHGYRVFSIITENRHGGINEHGVPDESVQAMRDRFEIQL